MHKSDLKKMSAEEQANLADNIRKIYLSKDRYAVASYLQCPYGSVGHLVAYLGVSLRELRLLKNEQYHSVCHYRNPFSSESDTKWYLIGFILGDGSLQISDTGHYNLVISQSDEDFIRKVGNLFGKKPYGPNRGNYTVDVYDDVICKVLINLGFVPNKSEVGMHLPPVSDEYFWSFALGLMDSDGSVLSKGKGYSGVIWWGHDSYMKEFKSRLESLGYSPSESVRKNHLYGVSLDDSHEAFEALSLMYRSTTEVKLSRKEDKFAGTIVSTRRVLTKKKSRELNELILKYPIPKNRTEVIELAKILGIGERCLDYRLVKLGIKHKPDYSKCGTYERKH